MTQTPKDTDIHVKSCTQLADGFLNVARYIVDVPTFAGGEMPNVSRELVHRPPASGVLLFDPIKETCVLIEQFRIGAMVANAEHGVESSSWLIEVVAGLHDKPGESPEASIIREAKEEADCDVKSLMKICEYFLGAGLTSEVIHLYIGFIDSTDAGGVHGVPDEAEDIKVHVMDMPTLKRRYEAGELNNGMTLIAVQWLLLNYDKVVKAGREVLPIKWRASGC